MSGPVAVPVPVLWNPSAGKKVKGPNGELDESTLADLFVQHGLTARIIATSSEEDAAATVRRLVDDGEKLIVGAGGDGTIGHLALQLLGTDVALGIVPLGSVMNIPRMLGLPRELEPAIDALVEQRTTTIDVGEANGRVFFETSSVGMNAAMFSAAQHFEEGDKASPLKVLGAALRYRPASMEIELDHGQQVHTRALMVTISNGAYTGVGLTVAPDAKLNDGRFDVRVFRHYSKFELLRHMASIVFGRRAYSPHVSTYRSAHVKVTGRRGLPIRADSYDLGETPLECHVRPASLRVVVGPEYRDGSAPTG